MIVDIDSELIWEPRKGYIWLSILCLPSREWVAPFRSALRLPECLRDEDEILKEICQAAHNARETALAENGNFDSVSERLRTRRFVSEALAVVETRLGSDARRQFKAWCYYSAVREEWSTALFFWSHVLWDAVKRKVSTQPIPQSLLALSPTLRDILDPTERMEQAKRIEAAAPPGVDPDAPDLESPEALLLLEIASNFQTADALRFLTRECSEAELESIVEWARSHAEDRGMDSQTLLNVQWLHSLDLTDYGGL